MTFRSQVDHAVFERIRQGQQIIEPRLYDATHRQVKIGDLILFIDGVTHEEVLAKVVGLLRFGSFKELFNAYPSSRFGASNEQELLAAMSRLYSTDQEMTHGVVGIKLHKLKS